LQKLRQDLRTGYRVQESQQIASSSHRLIG
jgi:hypothetical protein